MVQSERNRNATATAAETADSVTIESTTRELHAGETPGVGRVAREDVVEASLQ